MIFFSIILMIGTLTTFTDLKSKKIYNLHLIIAAVLGLIAAAYTAVFLHADILFHLTDGLIAFLIGFLLHRSGLWRGGDAKLFALYAFLMPAPLYNHTIFPCVVSLFACSFIGGMAILSPFFIKDIIINRQSIATELFSPVRRQAIFNGVGTIIFSSWILFPFYYLARMSNPVIILTISYLFFSWGGKVKKEAKKDFIIDFIKKNYIIIPAGIIFGILMRYWLAPNALSCPALTRYLMMITISSTLSICIQTTFNHFKDYQERIPFAPLLLMGCLLSYTPFFQWVMHLSTLMRQ